MTTIRRSSHVCYAESRSVFAGKCLIFPGIVAIAVFLLSVSLHAQQGPGGNQAAQQSWKLRHISAESARQELKRTLPADTAEAVIIQVNAETNEITLIGVANAVQAAGLALQNMDRQQPAVTTPYLNLPPAQPTMQAPMQPPLQAPAQETPLQPFRSTNEFNNMQPPQTNAGAYGTLNITAQEAWQQEAWSQEGYEPGTYYCKPAMAESVSRELQRRYGNNPAIEISDKQNGKLLVWAPPSVHKEINALLTQAGAWADVPQGRDPREFEGTLVRFASEPQPASTTQQPMADHTHAPKNVTLDQIEVKLQTLFGRRMIAMSKEGEKTKKYRVAVPKQQNTIVCELTLDYPNYKIHVKAPQNVAEQMTRLLDNIDQTAPEEGRDRRFISIQNTDPEQVRKLLDTYRSKAVPTSSLRRQGQNMFAHRPNGDPASFRQVTYTTQEGGGLGGGLGSGLGGFDGTFGGGTSPGVGPGLGVGPGGGIDGGFNSGTGIGETIGDGGITLIPGTESKIQVLNELDVVIIDAPMEEVRRIIDMIEQLKKLSELAQPEIEVMFLKHVQSEAVDAILRTQLRDSINPITGIRTEIYLYTEMFAAKQGRVWVLPLHNPNAMLLIGWGEAPKAMKDLIDHLDQPVEKANSLLRVIQLEHASAAEVATVLVDYFNPPATMMPGVALPGFQPRIRALSDTRTNTLIIQAAPNDYRDIESVIAALDVEKGNLKLQVRTFRMKNMLAADMATALQNALDMAINGREGERLGVVEIMVNTAEGRKIIESGFMTDVTIEAVAGNNTVIVTAPGNCLPLIAELIEMIDQSPGTAIVKVIRIEHSDAETIQMTLTNLFAEQMTGEGGIQFPGAEGGESFVPIKFATDRRSNSIVVSGSENDVFFIKTLINRLDQKDALQRELKTYPLRNTSALNVATAIRDFLERRQELQDREVISSYQQLQNAAIVVAEPIMNVLIIEAAEPYMSEILDMIEVLDQEPPQVMVQVLIAEVTLGCADEFGIELGLQDPKLFSRSSIVSPSELNPGFGFNDPTLGLGNSSSAESLATAGTVATQMLSNFATGRVNTDSGFGGLVFSASSDAVSVLIRAMQERNKVEILSRPQITAMDNQLAIIFVGQQVLRSKGTTIDNGTIMSNADDEDVGLFLGVIPRISKGDPTKNEQDKIVMLISASKSSLGAASDGMATVSSGTVIRTPNINKTRTETIVSALDGETVLLGGLITNDKEEVFRGIPYLSNVPVLGNFFKYEYERMKRSELIIIMRPRIIRKSEDMDAIKRVEFARMNWCLADVTKVHGDIGMYNPMAREPVTGGAPTFMPEPIDMSTLEEIPMPRGMSPGSSRPSTMPSTISTDPHMGVTVPAINSQSPMPSMIQTPQTTAPSVPELIMPQR